ncbi:MAG: helix-turn-helix domain-containing protein [Flavonifractor plautii]
MVRQYRYIDFRDREQIAARYLNGDRVADIAAGLGVTTATVYRELKRGETGELDRNQRRAYKVGPRRILYAPAGGRLSLPSFCFYYTHVSMKKQDGKLHKNTHVRLYSFSYLREYSENDIISGERRRNTWKRKSMRATRGRRTSGTPKITTAFTPM